MSLSAEYRQFATGFRFANTHGKHAAANKARRRSGRRIQESFQGCNRFAFKFSRALLDFVFLTTSSMRE